MLEFIGQTVGTIIIILVSAFAGASFILAGQVILKRRRLITALHKEILLNRVEIKSLRTKTSNESGGVKIFRFADIRTEVYNGMQTEDPTLYYDVCEFSRELIGLYNLLDTFEKFSNEVFLLLDTSPMKITRGENVFVLSDDDLQEDDTPTLLTMAETQAIGAAREIEDFMKSTLYRRVIYYGCIKESVEVILE